MTRLKYLEWDSRFYARDVYSLTLGEEDFSTDTLQELALGSLIYVYSHKKIASLSAPVDEKLILKCNLSPATVISPLRFPRCYIYSEGAELEKDLVDLALISSRKSRFRVDSQLSSAKADEMYSIWIRNAIDDPVRHRIFLARDHDAIAGMTSIKLYSEHANIELVAVRDQYQGMGLGGELISASMDFCSRLGLKEMYVTTQGSNEAARKLYEKNGFSVHDLIYIYHIHR